MGDGDARTQPRLRLYPVFKMDIEEEAPAAQDNGLQLCDQCSANHRTGGLVDDEQVLVFEQDVEGQSRRSYFVVGRRKGD